MNLISCNIIYILAVLFGLCAWALWANRTDIKESFKLGDKGFSSRKIIVFQLMFIICAILSVYVYELYGRQEWAQKIMIDVLSLILLYIAEGV